MGIFKFIFKNNFHFEFLTLLVCIIFLCPFLHIGILYLLMAILSFTLYDTIVFGIFLKKSYPEDKWPKWLEILYRISQFGLQGYLSYVLVINGFLYEAIGFNIAWWLTTYDILYYIILKAPFEKEKEYEYFWLANWSIFFVLKYISIKPTKKNFIIFSTIGFVLSLITTII